MANYLKIAVAIDFSEQSLKALDRASQLAKEHNAILQLVNVIDTKSFGAVSAYDLKYAEELKKENILKMEKLEKEALQTGVKEVESIVETGSPKGILTQLPQVDLIVCGATGLNRMEKMMLGSVAEKVVRHALCDVLIVR
ncbi:MULTISPECIES: universal stress protein [Lysinibacillus]|jgi:nucleotide-binding universal stress UspA family protein|uniref:Universal stress protein n=1 Tax=Lysinibacillus capsici TaxID=2115968 RepID=A0ABY8KL30_9BACI|nr:MULTISPECIES: universal stress protein [Lysinibacillus]AUS87729.1 universal stress protein [Lysinibacillus sp. YS11]MCS5500824.1 universal stress protein [Lysinibacillus sp. A4]MDP1392076.1 universal stress protein [Lysinibacillus capsici]MDP1412552.1 universal stress protein [Lysinibacillus capsici]MDP1428816.1 universal stress protein [Lysinibacillus capsici]